MDRIARIAYRISSGMVQAPVYENWYRNQLKQQDYRIFFVYDPQADLLVQGKDVVHRILVEKYDMLDLKHGKKGKEKLYEGDEWQSVDEYLDRVVRGHFWVPVGYLTFYEMYVNNRLIEPPAQYVNAVIAKLKVKPSKIYLQRVDIG